MPAFSASFLFCGIRHDFRAAGLQGRKQGIGSSEELAIEFLLRRTATKLVAVNENGKTFTARPNCCMSQPK